MAFFMPAFNDRTGQTINLDNGAVLTVTKRVDGHRAHAMYEVHCSICSDDSEMWPAGSITSTFLNLRNGFVPCGCSKCPNINKKQMVIAARRYAEKAGYKLFGIPSLTTQPKSKCFLWCDIHGMWNTTSITELRVGKGCPSCARKIQQDAAAKSKIMDEGIALSMVRSVAASRGHNLLRIDDYVAASKTKAHFSCCDHGEWSIPLTAYIRGRGCKKCAKSGFKDNLSGFVYALKSECGAYLKVGITNNLEARMHSLALKTPFNFKNVMSICGSGFKARALESECHKRFMSAGFRGFDGATEWLRYDDEILDVIQSASIE